MFFDYSSFFLRDAPQHPGIRSSSRTDVKMNPVLALLAFCKIIQLSDGHSAGDQLTCVTDYWLNITCTMNITDKPEGVKNSHYWLEFNETLDRVTTYKCLLVEMGNSYSCTFWANSTESRQSFADYNSFTVRLCYDIDCQSNYTALPDFKPSKHIKLTAPYNLNVQWTKEGYNVTWQSGYEKHLYIALKIDYTLYIYKNKKQVFSTKAEIPSTFIPGFKLEPDTTYALEIRSKIKSLGHYVGQWSQCSALVQFTTDAKEAQPNVLLVLSQFAFPVCVVAGVLLFVFYKPTTRMKIKAIYDVPTPAPFFQPLYKNYNGHFQDWLVSECNLTPMYKTEECVTIDTLSIEAKPITVDQELSGKKTNPLANDHTAYVDPSVMDWVCSHSPNGNGPGDIPYTQLPWSPLELQFGGKVTSLPKDAMVSYNGDSGCEDLTLSPETSWPNSPISSEAMCIHADTSPFTKSLNVSSPQFKGIYTMASQG